MPIARAIEPRSSLLKRNELIHADEPLFLLPDNTAEDSAVPALRQEIILIIGKYGPKAKPELRGKRARAALCLTDPNEESLELLTNFFDKVTDDGIEADHAGLATMHPGTYKNSDGLDIFKSFEYYEQGGGLSYTAKRLLAFSPTNKELVFLYRENLTTKVILGLDKLILDNPEGERIEF